MKSLEINATLGESVSLRTDDARAILGTPIPGAFSVENLAQTFVDEFFQFADRLRIQSLCVLPVYCTFPREEREYPRHSAAAAKPEGQS